MHLGDVSLIQKAESGRTYALKKVPIQKDVGVTSLNEIDVLTRLSHPSLIHARDVLPPGQEDVPEGCIGLVLPLGKWTLESAINQQLLSLTECVEIMWKLSSALAFLHQQSLLHLDLRPDHIILRGAPGKLRPLIADFSCVHYGKQLSLARLYTSSNYCPPELLKSKQEYIYTTKTDVWSLGIIFLEMLTGKIKEEPLPEIGVPEQRLSFLQKQLPVHYQDAVDLLFRMIDPDPETRIDSSDLLTSGFFITRLDHPAIKGEVVETVSTEESYVNEDFLKETFAQITEHIADFSTTAWLGAFNIYSRMSLDDERVFLVALFISYKLYDDPTDVHLDFFVSCSQLARDVFIDVEKGIILDLGGCIGYHVTE